MSDWLDPLRRALDAVTSPVPVFFRDDDAGWGDSELRAVLDRFVDAGVPVDVAVIPAELSPALTVELTRYVDGSDGRVAVHQHGWSHANHEPEGRKCEFGASRSHARQHDDIARGAAVMTDAFGTGSPRLFVPPWNRCTATTAAVLDELGFAALCRDVTAASLPGSRVRELPVTVDWFARRRGERVDRAGRGELLAESVGLAVGGPLRVGVMLHHAVMGADDLADLGVLLRLVADDARVQPGAMSDGVADGSSRGLAGGVAGVRDGVPAPTGSAG